MRTVQFAKGSSAIFEKAGLKSFEDFFNYSSGKIMTVNQKRNVIAFSLDIDGRRQHFFMKRFFNPHYKDMLFTFRNFGRFCSQAACEWQNTNILLQNGIPTYIPVCYGEETRLYLERKSFIITEKVPGRCLTDFIRDNWNTLSRDKKEKLTASLGGFVRKIHAARISMPDLYLWHIFIQSKDDQHDLAVIDLHRMSANARGNRWKIRNLGALNFSMTSKYFDQNLRDVFFNAYFGDDFDADKAAFRRKVTNYSMVLANRRRRPDY